MPLGELRDARVRAASTFQHQSASSPARQRHLVRGWRAARPSRSSAPRAPGKTTLVKLLVGLYPPQSGRDPLQRHRRHDASTSTACASGSASSPRTRSSSPARSARTCCSCNPDATDAECLDVLQQGGLRQPAGARRHGPRHGHRRRRREGVGRREAAALDRARAAAAARTCWSSTRPPRRSTR